MGFKAKRYVKVFNQVRLCEVEVHNELQPEYVYQDLDEVFWVERGEDEYGLPHYEKKTTPWVKLYRRDWLRGKACQR
jgi:hypothetical protein